MRPAAPGAISPAEIRAIIRDEMERERARRGVAPQPGQEAMGEAEMELLERRLADRIDEVITRRLGNQQPQQPVQPGVVVVPDRGGQADAAAIERRLNEMERRLSQQVDEAVRRRTAELEDEVERLRDEEREMVIVGGDTVMAAERQPGIFQRFQQMDLRETHPYIGVSFDPTQFVIGGRLNLGPVTPNSPFNLVPELAFGIGEDDPTLLLAANLQYNFGAIGGGIPLSPYVSVGGGLFSKTFLAVNAAVGTSVNLRDAGFGEPLRGFVEFQGLNLFNRQRLLVGLSIDTP
jgi:hypothetical protein